VAKLSKALTSAFPRYTGAGGDQAAGEGIPYLPEGEDVPYEFDIKVNLKTGLPLSDIWVKSHSVDINKQSVDEAEVILSYRKRL